MRKILSVLFVATMLIPVIVSARPVRTVLVVQNHAGDEFSKPLSNIGSRLRAKLAGTRFAIIDPNDRVGTAQNRGPYGEPLPPSSAVNLALAHEGELLLTASIDEASVDTIGVSGPRQRQFAQMTITLAAVQLPLGESVLAETFTAKSDSVPSELFATRANVLYNQTIQRLIDGVSKKFLVACESADSWVNVTVPDYITVGFGCNLSGANVLLDGLSYGTAGTPGSPVLKVRTWRGIHHIRIESDFMHPFETEAMLEDNTSFLTVLKENEEGRKLRKEDRYFDLLMQRIEKSGNTDDAVRILRADGYSKYLSSSYTRIMGMPQVLSSHDFNPDFGLSEAVKDDAGTSTSEMLQQLGATIETFVSEVELSTDSVESAKTDTTRNMEPSAQSSKDAEEKDRKENYDEEKKNDTHHINISSSSITSADTSCLYPEEQMVVEAVPVTVATSSSVGTSKSTKDALDSISSKASLVKSVLNIWNMVH